MLVEITNQTPIEVMLKIDKDGFTTARNLYEFLELDKSNYSRWCKNNILENQFAEEGIDFLYSSLMTSKGKGNLIGVGWGYEQIKQFIHENHIQQIAV